jgi:hypothetical protein
VWICVDENDIYEYVLYAETFPLKFWHAVLKCFDVPGAHDLVRVCVLRLKTVEQIHETPQTTPK